MKRFLLAMVVVAVVVVPSVAAHPGSGRAYSQPYRLHWNFWHSTPTELASQAQSNSRTFWASATQDIETVAVPEPGSLFLIGSGLLVGATYLRKRFFEKQK